MTGRTLSKWALPAAFVAACAVALAAAFGPCARRTDDARRAGAEPRAEVWRVAWRAPVGARPNAPSRAFPEGWIVTDEAGGVTALSENGARVWRTALSNQVFEAAAFVSEELVVVASAQGRVTALRAGTGEAVWSEEVAEARFQHKPLGGRSAGGEEAVRLVSQPDGRLFCFRLADGKRVWQSEPTNRCDGEPAAWPEGIAYGNCDGAVHVFDVATGALKGSVAVGENDQMAGGLLWTGTGLLVAGTRQGSLVAVKAATLTCEARVQVSSGEAFLKPALAFDGLIAMGTQEGALSFWRFDGKGLQPAGRAALGQPVSQLESYGGRLFVLAGGALRIMDAPDGEPVSVALGDEVYGLTARCRCSVACVADGAVVLVKGASDE